MTQSSDFRSVLSDLEKVLLGRCIYLSCKVLYTNYGMREPLLGDKVKPRPSLDHTPRRHIDFCTEGSILNLRFVKNMMRSLPKPV